MLAVAGFDEAQPKLSVPWPVLKTWAALPVQGMAAEADADMLLFECSLELKPPDNDSLGPSFTVGFTRQFSFEDEEGDYSGMEQVGVDLRYPGHDEFRAFTRMAEWSDQFGTADQFWGSGGPRAADWAARVEASRSYQTALRHQATRVALFHIRCDSPGGCSGAQRVIILVTSSPTAGCSAWARGAPRSCVRQVWLLSE